MFVHVYTPIHTYTYTGEGESDWLIDGDWLARLPGPKLFGQAANLEIVAGVSCSLDSEGNLQANSLLSGGAEFFLLRPLTNWMRPAHIAKGNRFYSV